MSADRQVNAAFPRAAAGGATGIANETAQLASGMFHKVAHEAKGTATMQRLPGGKKVLD